MNRAISALALALTTALATPSSATPILAAVEQPDADCGL